MEEIFALISSLCPVSPELAVHLTHTFKEKTYKKNEYLLKEGNTCGKICFIVKGLTRCFYNNGILEVCSWFMKEGDMIVSVESFFQQKPSSESIQAIEDCEVIYITYEELQFMYKNFPEMNYIGRVLTEKYYILSEQRLYSLRMHRAGQRYQHLLENFPELVQRVPVKYIASYLGVAKETLSRNRSKKKLKAK